MPKRWSKLLLILVTVWTAALMPGYALAQDATLTCNASGGVAGGVLFDVGTGGDYCTFTGIKHVFSHVVCRFMTIMNTALGKLYCGLQFSFKEVVAALITLYIAVFGVQMAMGLTPLTIKEGSVRLLKIAAVWLFATESTHGIALAFAFFLNLAGSGITWVMEGIKCGLSGSCQLYGDPSSVCYNAAIRTVDGFMLLMARMDEYICNAVSGPITQSNAKVIGFFLAMMAIAPPVFFLALQWLWMNLMIMLQGLKVFLLGVASIAFLISMTPIFMSLMLFKATHQFFETWLRYLISFSLQIIVIFTCIAMWIIITLNFIGFFNNLSDVIFPMSGVLKPSTFENVSNNWGFCPGYTYRDGANGPEVTCPPGYDPNNQNTKPLPVSALMLAEDGQNHTKLLYYIVYHLITLTIICYAFSALISQAPAIAVYLAGPEYVPMLGDGFSLGRGGNLRTIFSSDSDAAKAKAGGGKDGSDEPSSPRAPISYSQQLRQIIGNRPTRGPDASR